jgi:tRNA(fMet)-specific endonuclease VapC
MNRGNVLVDTNIVIAHFRQDDFVSQKIADTSLVFLPSIALGELYYGAYKSNNPQKKLEQLVLFLPHVLVLEVCPLTSDYYGRIRLALSQAGSIIPENDIWIAALAMQHQLPIATRDQHFMRISGLTVFSW